MNKLDRRERALADKRADLLTRSTAHRAQIAHALGGMQPGLAGAERAYQAGRWVREHAMWIGLAGAALLIIKRPRGVLRMAAQAWSLWQGWRRLGH